MAQTGRVLGIGGVFFKSGEPKALKAWYCEHLGITPDDDGYVSFKWKSSDAQLRDHRTVWEPFPSDTKYFDPSRSPFMVNYIVDDLDAILQRLRSAGAEVDDRVEEYDYGRFGWAMDPQGNRIELWEPSKP